MFLYLHLHFKIFFFCTFIIHLILNLLFIFYIYIFVCSLMYWYTDIYMFKIIDSVVMPVARDHVLIEFILI